MLKYIYGIVLSLVMLSGMAVADDNYNRLSKAQRVALDAEYRQKIAETALANLKEEGPIANAATTVTNKVIGAGGKVIDALPTTPEKAATWANVGTQVGKALGDAARELGSAANEFVRTPVGMMTAGIILYKYVGNDLLATGIDLTRMVFHIIAAGCIFFIGGAIWIWSYRRAKLDRIVIDKLVPEKGWRANTKKTVIYQPMGDDTAGWHIFFAIFIVVASPITLFSF